MKRFGFAVLAVAAALVPASSVAAQDMGMRSNDVKMHADHDRDHHDHGCRMVITKIHHHGTTITKRERKCM
jgi:hypothetical protein